MNRYDALILILFGIILPTFDVFSDLYLSFRLMVPKNCNGTYKQRWFEYLKNHYGDTNSTPSIFQYGKYFK